MGGKRSKKLIALAGVLCAACVITLILLGVEQRQEDIRTSGEVILQIPRDSITALSWTSPQKSPMDLHLEGSTWIYDEDSAFPVNGDKIADMLEQFENFTAAFIIESAESLSDYGLDTPTATIEITSGSETQEIKLGSFSTMDSQRYVSIGDGNVYLVQHDPFSDFDLELSDLILHDQIPHLETIETLELNGEDSLLIQYHKEGGPSLRADDQYFTQYHGKEVPLDNGLVEGFLYDLSHTSLRNYVTYNATYAELEQYGMTDPQLVIDVRYADENDQVQTFTFCVSRDPKELSSVEAQSSDEKDDTDVTAYARVGNSPIVYQISGEAYEDLMASTYSDLRHHEVLPADYSSIAEMEIELDSSDYTFTVESAGKEEDSSPVLLYDGSEFDATDVQNALTSMIAQEFTEASPSGRTEVTVRLTLSNETATSVTISLSRYDGAQCLAVVDGQPFALVDRGQVVSFMEAVRAIVLAPKPSSEEA